MTMPKVLFFSFLASTLLLIGCGDSGLRCADTECLCSDGTPIDESWVCDSEEDCFGGEDESGCPGYDGDSDSGSSSSSSSSYDDGYGSYGDGVFDSTWTYDPYSDSFYWYYY